MENDSKQGPKGITLTDVVLGVVCPPALMGKLAVEAAEIKAKERKEREAKPFNPEDERGDTLLFCLLGGLAAFALIYGLATGEL